MSEVLGFFGLLILCAIGLELSLINRHLREIRDVLRKGAS